MFPRPGPTIVITEHGEHRDAALPDEPSQGLDVLICMKARRIGNEVAA